MQIRRFWARGYRSLVDVDIDNFGPFNIFYGRNGTGKSNILAAMRTFFRLLGECRFDAKVAEALEHYHGDPAIEIVETRDRCHLSTYPVLDMGAVLTCGASNRRPPSWPAPIQTLQLALTYEWEYQRVKVTKIKCDGKYDLTEWSESVARRFGLPGDRRRSYYAALGTLLGDIAQRAFTLVDADRNPRVEHVQAKTNSVAELLAQGRLKEGLLLASGHRDPRVRSRYREFRTLLEGPPLERPPFDITHDPTTGRVEVVESVVRDGEPYDVPIDLIGLGQAQMYGLLGQALLGGTDAAGIEEPEAHLHAPTTGVALRSLLVRLVEEGYLDQLFIATHSNLFDLDPDGYFDVSHDPERGTQVQRAALSEIDRQHLYEPGPAKHALQRCTSDIRSCLTVSAAYYS